MPYEYSTNSTAFDGWAMRGTQGIAEPESIAPAMAQLKESLAWISSNFRKNALLGATLCAMILRHFFRDDHSGATHDQFLHATINSVAAASGHYLYAGVDELIAMIAHKLTKAPNEGPHGAVRG
jgi:hypothetical protein